MTNNSDTFSSARQYTNMTCSVYAKSVLLGFFLSFLWMQGLIHISELSWDLVMVPENVVQVGDVVRCKVVSTNTTNGNISLSLKVSRSGRKAHECFSAEATK